MKLIEIKTGKKLANTIYKENIVVNEINGVKYRERIKTGIPDKVKQIEETIYIPIDKIDKLYEFGDKYFINDIQIPKQTFDKIKKEIEDYGMEQKKI